jgi:hypothetical protein
MPIPRATQRAVAPKECTLPSQSAPGRLPPQLKYISTATYSPHDVEIAVSQKRPTVQRGGAFGPPSFAGRKPQALQPAKAAEEDIVTRSDSGDSTVFRVDLTDVDVAMAEPQWKQSASSTRLRMAQKEEHDHAASKGSDESISTATE